MKKAWNCYLPELRVTTPTHQTSFPRRKTRQFENLLLMSCPHLDGSGKLEFKNSFESLFCAYDMLFALFVYIEICFCCYGTKVGKNLDV